MATGVAPMARIDSCQIGAGGVRIRRPARSAGVLMGLLVIIWRKPCTQKKDRILNPIFSSSWAFQALTVGRVASFWTSSSVCTKYGAFMTAMSGT
jgi:hypothetical protein